MSGFKLPGVVWSALLVALPLLSVWLSEFFSAAIWAAPVAGLLLIIAKVVGVVQGTEPAPPVQPAAGAAGGPRPAGDVAPAPVEPQPSRAARLLWG